MFGEQPKGFLQELRKLGGRCLAACLGKFAMFDPALAGCMSPDFDVIGRVYENQPGGLFRTKVLRMIR